MQHSTYTFQCVCGKEITSETKEGSCPACLRLFYVDRANMDGSFPPWPWKEEDCVTEYAVTQVREAVAK